MSSSILIYRAPCKIFSKISKFETCIVLNHRFKSQESVPKDTIVFPSITYKNITKKFRCKDVSKLITVDKKVKLIKPGQVVLDVGAAPGSWSEYLAEKTNSNKKDPNEPAGVVLATDLIHFENIDGVYSLPKLDFFKESSQEKISEVLGNGKQFDVVVSDISPSTLLSEQLNEKRMLKTIFCLFIFMAKHLKKGGSCFLNVSSAENNRELRAGAKKLFRLVSFCNFNQPASNSPTIYLMGREFGIKGQKKVKKGEKG